MMRDKSKMSDLATELESIRSKLTSLMPVGPRMPRTILNQDLIAEHERLVSREAELVTSLRDLGFDPGPPRQ